MMDIKKLANLANTLNTINGGMVSPDISFDKHQDHYLVTVKVAGVNRHQMRVEINNQLLFIYHILSEEVGPNQHTPLTHVVETMPLPIEVDYQKITAKFHGDTLLVTLPFNELQRNYRKAIDIS